MSASDADWAGLAPEAEGRVFGAPWQAQAFALAVRLHAQGAFTWAEWTQALGRELALDREAGQDGYYAAWVAALEALCPGLGIDADRLAERKTAWAEAYMRTPHGMPVQLAK